MRCTGSFNNLTTDSRDITNHRTLLTKPSTQNFIVFSRKHKPLSLGTKLWFSCWSWLVGPRHTSWQQSLTPNPAFSITGPFAGETPPKPLAFRAVPEWAFWNCYQDVPCPISDYGSSWKHEQPYTCQSCGFSKPEQKSSFLGLACPWPRHFAVLGTESGALCMLGK